FKPAQQTSLSDLVATLAGLKQLQPEAEKQPDPFAVVTRVLDMTEKIQERTGGNSTGATWTDLISDGLGMAKPIVEGIVARVPVPQVPMLGAAPSLPVSPVPAVAPFTSPSPLNSPTSNPTPAVNSQPSVSQPPQATQGDPQMLALLPYVPWLRAVLQQFA